MPDGEKPGEPLAPPPIQPLPVTMIGVREDGTGVPMTDGQVVVTPASQPNLVIRVITPIVAISVRFVNAYITTLVGLVTVGLTTDVLPTADFGQLVLRCASLSLAGPCVSLAKDLITILGGLERKYPLSTGSV